ncbi:MAG: hypothetical protein M1820_004684 [Bogoriella megaspora]|nr:MAG: hypothetical protein M1820_004684 [Bogoriella megaspora]
MANLAKKMDGAAVKIRKLNGSKGSVRVLKRGKRSHQKGEYHSSSEDEPSTAGGIGEDLTSETAGLETQDDGGVRLELEKSDGPSSDGNTSADGEDQDNNGDIEPRLPSGLAETDESDDMSSELDDSSEADVTSNTGSKKRKRNDPDAFATSISKILNSKLSTSKRSDPVLSRSKDASEASKQLADSRLEYRAKNKLREDKKAALEKGRVKDVLGLNSADTSTAEIMEEEKRLRKTAQRGVIKLFNAVRAAQIKGEEAAKEARKTGVVGMANREEKVNEMSKKGFLDLIAAGGKKPSITSEST